MAFIKTTTTDAGVTVVGSYWRIEAMRMDFPNDNESPPIATRFSGYASSEARDSLKPPFEIMEIFIPMGELLQLAASTQYEDLRAAAYTWAKSNCPDFENATDA